MAANGSEPIEAQVVDAVPVQHSAMVVRERAAVLLAPVMNIEVAKQRLREFQEFVKFYLVEDEDFGKIPGTPKPTLYKSGADKLCELYGLADNYSIVTQVEDFNAEPPLFDYTIKCTLTSRRDDSLVSTGMGSCNSWEGKYKYRDTQRTCPTCGKAAIIKGSEQYGGGWVCWKKKEGCGAKFSDSDTAITSQAAGKTLNDDIPTLKNTILKMAKKRAKIDATLAATRSSGIFTQDIEDFTPVDDGSGSKQAAQAVAQRKIDEAGKKVEANRVAADKAAETIIELRPYHGGMLSIYNVKGQGLATLAFADLAAHAQFLEEEDGEGTWCIKAEDEMPFRNWAMSQGVDSRRAPAPTAPVSMPHAAPYIPSDEDIPFDVPDTGKKVITAASLNKAKKQDKEGRDQYMKLTWDGQEWNVATWFHGLFPLLTECFTKQIPVKLITKAEGKFKNVLGIEGAEKGQDGIHRWPIQHGTR